MNREPREGVLAEVHEARHGAGPNPCQDPHGERDTECPRREGRMEGDGKDRPGSEERNADERGGDRGHGHRYQAPGLPLEEEQLDSEEEGRHRGGEHRRHSGGGPGREERLPLGGREPEELGEDRAKGASRHDDGSLCAERAARPYRQGGRNGLQDGDLWVDQAPSEKDRLEGLGDSVPADLLGAVTGHVAYEKRPYHGHGDHPKPKVVRLRGHRRRRPAHEERGVRDHGDQPKQDLCDDGADGSDRNGQEAEEEDAPVGAKVGQPVSGGVLLGWLRVLHLKIRA